jgi:hypothetical protein
MSEIVCSLCRHAGEDPSEFDFDYGDPYCKRCVTGVLKFLESERQLTSEQQDPAR